LIKIGFIKNYISPDEFYIQIAKSKYVLSPEGTGIDCHRIYESIFFNTIPILKTSELDYFYESLPVLIIKNWDEINQDYLELNYFDLKIKLEQWLNTNPNWMKAEYWIKN